MLSLILTIFSWQHVFSSFSFFSVLTVPIIAYLFDRSTCDRSSSVAYLHFIIIVSFINANITLLRTQKTVRVLSTFLNPLLLLDFSNCKRLFHFKQMVNRSWLRIKLYPKKGCSLYIRPYDRVNKNTGYYMLGLAQLTARVTPQWPQPHAMVSLTVCRVILSNHNNTLGWI